MRHAKKPRFFFRRLPYFIFKMPKNPRRAFIESQAFRKGFRMAVKIFGIGHTLLIRMENEAQSLAAAQPMIGRTLRPGARADQLPWPLIASIRHIVSNLRYFYMISRTLYRRTRSTSIVPSLVICHDLYALLAAVRLKRLYGCAVLYDSHELWPEAFIEARQWEKKVIAALERRAIRCADAVVTVTPQIARHLERLYTLNQVVTASNAEPFVMGGEASCHRPIEWPMEFLLQGRAAPGRRFESLLEACRESLRVRLLRMLRVQIERQKSRPDSTHPAQ